MKKKIVIIFLSLILILSSLIIYLSTAGIKTNRFNPQIIKEIKKIEPNIDIKIKEVKVNLNIFDLSLDAKTVGADLRLRDKIIKLENIKSKISLKSLVSNKFALSQIIISTESLSLKNLIGFLRQVNRDTKLFIAEQAINNGFVVVNFRINFDDLGRVKNDFLINGLINDGQISIFSKKINKIDFNFKINQKEFKFKNVKFLYEGKSSFIPELSILEKNKNFLFSGKLINKNLYLKNEEIKDLINNDHLKSNLNEVKFDAESKFDFEITQKLKVKNLNVKSNINLEYLKIKNSLTLKDYFPNIKDNFLLKDQKIELKFNKKILSIIGSGKIFLQNQSDIIKYEIISKEGQLKFNSNLKINENPFVINLLEFEKEEKSQLNLSFVGETNKNGVHFEKIFLSENKNIIFIKDLKLTSNYEIDDFGDIKIDYLDKKRFNNKIQVQKNKKIYNVIGDGFNINQIISKLLKNKTANSHNIFNKKFIFYFNIKEIYLDKVNTTYNLKGSLLFNRNEIYELDLETEFLDKQKIKFTIKTTDDGEKITTLFSNEAKPLVDRYQFIKGFNEGVLDFYSIKKNNLSKSTLKIYDFKLKELPALTKILTLASLQGIADLLSGEGIRFNDFEMKFTNKKNLMTIDEIYAIGPAISILMEGYVEKNQLISLRGTLVPATTINKTISSIPLLGEILVGKKTGEGVFGVSFKIKGPPKNLETTVNPIKTLTPRFITRTLEKIKKTN